MLPPSLGVVVLMALSSMLGKAGELFLLLLFYYVHACMDPCKN